MAKQKKKTITIDDLALMVGKGFADMDERFNAIDARFNGVDSRFDKVDKRLLSLELRMDGVGNEVGEIRKHQFAHTIYRDEWEKMQNRVKALEKIVMKP